MEAVNMVRSVLKVSYYLHLFSAAWAQSISYLQKKRKSRYILGPNGVLKHDYVELIHCHT